MRLQILLAAALSALVVVAACGQNSPIANGSDDAGQSGAGGGGNDTDGGSDGGSAVPDCTGKVYDAGTYDWTLVHDGKTRSFRVHVPAQYDRSKKTPLVFNFHGYTSFNTQQESISKMTPIADREGFIVVYANGLTGAEAGGFGNVRSWNAGACCGTAQQNNIDDVGFVVKMIDLANDRFCIDGKRVFSTGFSNGGLLSHRLACEQASRIAAISPVAAVNGMATCTPSRKVPVLHFHGTNDPLVPYNGNAQFVSVRSSMDSWALRNGCSANPQTTSTRGDVTCERYPNCADGADTELCTVADGGHAWPGGADLPGTYTTQAVKASEELWEFFKAHPMP